MQTRKSMSSWRQTGSWAGHYQQQNVVGNQDQQQQLSSYNKRLGQSDRSLENATDTSSRFQLPSMSAKATLNQMRRAYNKSACDIIDESGYLGLQDYATTAGGGGAESKIELSMLKRRLNNQSNTSLHQISSTTYETQQQQQQQAQTFQITRNDQNIGRDTSQSQIITFEKNPYHHHYRHQSVAINEYLLLHERSSDHLKFKVVGPESARKSKAEIQPAPGTTSNKINDDTSPGQQDTSPNQRLQHSVEGKKTFNQMHSKATLEKLLSSAKTPAKRRCISILLNGAGGQNGNQKAMNCTQENFPTQKPHRIGEDVSPPHGSNSARQLDLKEGSKDTQKALQKMMREMNRETMKKVIEGKMIEEWINETLKETEEMRRLPTAVISTDARLPVTRYGIDRITLTNAGIPNEDVTRLYKSLFVHSLGYLTMIKEITVKVQETHIGANPTNAAPNWHLTKPSVVSSIWKVFSMLLEHSHYSDYKLLISTVTESLRQQVAQLELDYLNLQTTSRQTEQQLQEEIYSLNRRISQLNQAVKDEQLRCERAEEELSWNQKSHEDEVALRLRFEDKLNELHQIHREMQRKEERSRREIEELFFKQEELGKELNEAREYIGRLKLQIQSCESQITNQGLQMEQLEADLMRKSASLGETEAKLEEMTQLRDIAVSNYELALKDCRTEQDRITHLKEQMKSLQASHDHYTKECEDLQSRGSNLNRRIADLEAVSASQLADLKFYKAEYEAFDSVRKFKDGEIESCSNKIRELTSSVDSLSQDNSQLRVKLTVAENDIAALTKDNAVISNNIRQLNKQREEMKSFAERMDQEWKSSEARNEQKDQRISELLAQMNEMDATLTSQNEKLNFLEQEKKAGRLDFDNSRRLLNERLSNLDAQVCNEMEAKKMWQDKYTKENQLLSKANIEVTELKNKLIESNSKVMHLEVELKGVTQQATNLASSKKELQLTLNNYIAQCDSLENELFTIKEVSLDYEKAKQEEFMHMNIKLEKYTLHFNQAQMEIEDLRTRCASQVVVINRIRKTILKLGLILSFLTHLAPRFKETLVETITAHDALQARQTSMEQEVHTSKQAYTYMKGKLGVKDAEIEAGQKEIQSLQKQVQRLEDINGRLFSEIQGFRERASTMQTKIIQVGGVADQRDKATNCGLDGNGSSPERTGGGTTPRYGGKEYISEQKGNPAQKLIYHAQEQYQKQKQQREEKKKQEREQMFEISKVQNEIAQKYDISGLLRPSDLSGGTGSKIQLSKQVSPRIQQDQQVQQPLNSGRRASQIIVDSPQVYNKQDEQLVMHPVAPSQIKKDTSPAREQPGAGVQEKSRERQYQKHYDSKRDQGLIAKVQEEEEKIQLNKEPSASNIINSNINNLARVSSSIIELDSEDLENNPILNYMIPTNEDEDQQHPENNEGKKDDERLQTEQKAPQEGGDQQRGITKIKIKRNEGQQTGTSQVKGVYGIESKVDKTQGCNKRIKSLIRSAFYNER